MLLLNKDSVIDFIRVYCLTSRFARQKQFLICAYRIFYCRKLTELCVGNRACVCVCEFFFLIINNPGVILMYLLIRYIRKILNKIKIN